MSLAKQRIDVQAGVAEQERSIANRIAPGILQQAGGANLSHDARALENFADADRVADLTHEVGRKVAPEIAHLRTVECGRCNDEITVASAREVGVARTRFKFGDKLVAEFIPRHSFEVRIVVGASTFYVAPRERADFFRRDFRDAAAKSIGADD